MEFLWCRSKMAYNDRMQDYKKIIIQKHEKNQTTIRKAGKV